MNESGSAIMSNGFFILDYNGDKKYDEAWYADGDGQWWPTTDGEHWRQDDDPVDEWR
jgi:hypothetical protein